jgi:large subunit ribosomal protein L11
MAGKKIKTQVKLNLPAGAATPAPPLGPTLAQHGIPIMEFVKEYNDRTADQRGNVVPVVLTIFEDRSFSFELKTAPVSALIKKELGIEKGSGATGKQQAGRMTMDQVKKIAEAKMQDLNTNDLQAAMNTVMGTARSMGVKVE